MLRFGVLLLAGWVGGTRPVATAAPSFVFYFSRWSGVTALAWGMLVAVCLAALVVTLYHYYRNETQPLP